MKIYNLLLIFISVVLLSCGVKSKPISKDTLNIPYPKQVELAISDTGIIIKNNEKDLYILVQRRNYDESGLLKNIYHRLSLIKPGDFFLDKDVTPGSSYSYGFRAYYPLYNTYSNPVSKNITYYIPVKIDKVNIKEIDDIACIKAELNKITKYADLIINGKFIDHIRDKKVCFNMPNSLLLNILIIPYDNNGNPGLPYKSNFYRNEDIALLPPQNIKVYREKDKAILSWDKGKNIDNYEIYINDKGKDILLGKIDITLFNYILTEPNSCIEFKLNSVRKDKKSPTIIVESCP